MTQPRPEVDHLESGGTTASSVDGGGVGWGEFGEEGFKKLLWKGGNHDGICGKDWKQDHGTTCTQSRLGLRDGLWFEGLETRPTDSPVVFRGEVLWVVDRYVAPRCTSDPLNHARRSLNVVVSTPFFVSFGTWS